MFKREGPKTLITQVTHAIQNFSVSEQRSMAPADRLWSDELGQDIAEYAVMVAVILIIVVGTIRLIGTNANTVFSNVASSIQ